MNTAKSTQVVASEVPLSSLRDAQTLASTGLADFIMPRSRRLQASAM